MLMQPLISVITPFRNAVLFLPQLVETLQAQTYRHWECLMVDDASTDSGSEQLFALAAGDPRFRCWRLDQHQGGGAGLAAVPRNEALRHSRGQLICFLDVDDLWHPTKLERQVAWHQRHQLDLSVTAYGRFHDQQPDSILWRCPPAVLTLRHVWQSNPIPLLTVMIKAELISSFPLQLHEDYLLWLQLWTSRPGLRYGCLPEVLALHRRHSANTTAKRPQMALWTYQVYHAAGQPGFRALLLLLLFIWHQAATRLLEVLGFRNLRSTQEGWTRQPAWRVPLQRVRFNTARSFVRWRRTKRIGRSQRS